LYLRTMNGKALAKILKEKGLVNAILKQADIKGW
jgi:hypothetical protein